jgi:hypothetical protein
LTGSEWSETIAGHEAESIRPSKTGENKVSTLAQVQADTISDEVKRLVIADQFATEWLLVTENDRDSYEQLRESAQEADNIVALSEVLREEWENLAEQVTELVRDRIGETASLFIAQMLQGQGSLPFDIIARQTLDNFKN